MDESILFDPPSSTSNACTDTIYSIPLDYSLLTDDLSFPQNPSFALPQSDLDFTIEDLEFIDDLISDPDPTSPHPNSSQSTHNSNSQHPPRVSPEEHLQCDNEDESSKSSNNPELPPSPDSCQSSKDENFATNPVKIEVTASKFPPKRKKEEDEDGERSADTRTSKFRRSEIAEDVKSDGDDDDCDRKKARLMRNRESAQLSRQRKKQYVDELEDKVKAMHCKITELNSKMSFVMAENAGLRQQLSGGGACPPPGMFPIPPMGYYPPWMGCAPPYVVKAHGSQVPLVPIPRLKPQPKPASVPRVSRRGEKTKKVASVSFLGLLFFMLLFGGLVPIVNVKYGNNESSKAHNGRVLMVNGGLNETSHDSRAACGIFKGKLCGASMDKKEHSGKFGTGVNGSATVGNSSEPLAASLYVLRNDKLVKIDGNLIIHSVLASERAKGSHETMQTNTSEETRLAIARNYAPSYHASVGGQSNSRSSQLDDGKLQEWFSQDISGSLLRSGMCTEVFQFDVSPTPGSIVPATPLINNTTDQRKNSGNRNKSKNRRILSGYPVPLDLHALNVTKEHVGSNTGKGGLRGDNTSSSMVVSVLVDPREAGESDGDERMRPKSVSRIFVVVLIDSVKYVTYSCMLPLMGGSGLNLVTS